MELKRLGIKPDKSDSLLSSCYGPALVIDVNQLLLFL